MNSTMQVYVENTFVLEIILRPTPKDRLESIQELAQPLTLFIANIVHGMYGVEINIQSMQRDGTESWVVISRGIEKYVVECIIDHVEAMHDDSQDLSTEKSAASVEHKGAPLSRTTEDAPIPMSQKNGVHIPAVKHTEELCYMVSKAMTNLMRHCSKTWTKR